LYGNAENFYNIGTAMGKACSISSPRRSPETAL